MVFVHGFTQTGRSWLPVAEQFAADHEVVLVDAAGHGYSSDIRANLQQGADLLAATTGEADYVGYSMGGRLCLHLALAHPHLVRSLTLLGATAGIEDPIERAQRRAADEVLACNAQADGVEKFLVKWLALPLFATLPVQARALEDRLQNTAAGLASSLRLAGTGSQQPLWDHLAEITAPVLVLAGEFDDKFTNIAHRLVEGIGPRASFAAIGGAGHAAHLEQPDAVVAAIRRFGAAL